MKTKSAFEEDIITYSRVHSYSYPFNQVEARYYDIGPTFITIAIFSEHPVVYLFTFPKGKPL